MPADELVPAAARPLVVTIDGPAGAGKTTVARGLARALRLPLLDTGAIYRTVALAAERAGIAWDDEVELTALCRDFPITFAELDPTDASAPQQVGFRGADVTHAIRTPAISQGASRVSAVPGVRQALLGIQRALGEQGCVAEGRDMGTVVFPHAPFKFFLEADLRTRAARRHADLQAGGGTGPAPEVVDRVIADIEARDARDSSRATAPLSCPVDAVRLDTTELSADEVVARMLARIRGHAAAPGRG